jgi:putative peptidoglycan binding protein
MRLTWRVRRSLVPALVALLALAPAASAQEPAVVPPVAPALPATGPFTGQGMWIWEVSRSERGDVAAIASRAAGAGMSFVVVKAAHGTVVWPQFSSALVDGLHAAGLRVCAYQRALGRRPAAEARVLARFASAGADCLVIDAEIEYQGKYWAARSYVRALRAAIGPSFPVGLTSFPYVDLHGTFPYSVFLGDGGAQYNLPQMYWRLLGTSVSGVFARTWAANAVYGRPLAPLGQSFAPASRVEVRRFRSLAAARGAVGVSWWVWQHASNAHWAGMTDALAAPVSLFAARPAFTPLRRGSVGDPVRWLQLRLRAAGERVPVTGRFLNLTSAAVARFREKAGLPAGTTVDDAAWTALLAAAPIDTPPPAETPPAAPVP